MVPLLGRRSCGRPGANRSRLDARTGLSHNPLLLLSVENAIDIRNAHRDHGEVLAAIVRETIERRGRVIVPAFAVGRVEEVIYWLKRLEEEKRIPVVPVYLDSPMAVDALRHYANRSHDLDPEMQARRGQMGAFTTRRFTAVTSPRQSQDLQAGTAPAIIISSSGMAAGGRVLWHLKTALSDPHNTVLFVGYQAEGTRGRHLLEGAREVKIHGRYIPVGAQIASIDSMSAHADANEILRWLGGFRKAPARTFLVHGEPAAQKALCTRIEQELGWAPYIPDYAETVEL
ncbi:MAG TPA: hypothetical protein DCQ64_11645 [Candidatus Rokubacteria bacterium]|nr:hypothetical protein [Candidatus Rokubacteria bacterium]